MANTFGEKNEGFLSVARIFCFNRILMMRQKYSIWILILLKIFIAIQRVKENKT